jgi:methylmalonyl-CoA mutase C-terminal domain/subunit
VRCLAVVIIYAAILMKSSPTRRETSIEQKRRPIKVRRSIRVLIAKPGLDGHDRGAIALSMGLRDHGMEVIYTGLRQSAESIVRVCSHEDVDVLGLSLLSGGHNHYFPKILDLLKEEGMGHILVLAGGIIPKEDRIFLKEKGIKEIFGPGSSTLEIAEFIKENVRHEDS